MSKVTLVLMCLLDDSSTQAICGKCIQVLGWVSVSGLVFDEGLLISKQ